MLINTFSKTLLFKWLYLIRSMMWRRVNGVEFGLGTGNNIVLGATGHKNRAPILICPPKAVNLDNPTPTLDAEKLITVAVDFAADFFTGSQGHQDQLHVVRGIYHCAISLVNLAETFDISNKASLSGVNTLRRQRKLRIVVRIIESFTAFG